MKRLFEIQQKLKASKDLFNSFGGYSYRSCEQILEAVKPLLKEQEVVLSITDEIIQLGERFYVKATAALYDLEGKEIHHVYGFARETEDKKGMDASQVTGATSSYARKYAMNGLFCIDDQKDADATNKHEDKNENKNINNDIQKEKLVCPICGEKITESALKAWGKCAKCKQKENKEKAVNNG